VRFASLTSLTNKSFVVPLIHRQRLCDCLIEDVPLFFNQLLGLCYLSFLALDLYLDPSCGILHISAIRNIDSCSSGHSNIFHSGTTLTDQRRDLACLNRNSSSVRGIYRVLKEFENLISCIISTLRPASLAASALDWSSLTGLADLGKWI